VVAGREVAMEHGFPADTVAELERRGHRLSFAAPESAFGFGGAQLIHRLPDGGYVAGSDHRKDGGAVGF
jgi:gamma-glutamyltranspeptidase/glutathione hydrolase